MPDPIYKFINVHYFDSLCKLLNEEFGIKTDRDTLEKLYKENNCRSFLAINDRKVVGHVLVEKRFDFINYKYYYILSHFCIKREYRRLGIGTALIKRLENHARRNKIYYLEFVPGNVSVKSLGFLKFNHFNKKKDNIFFKKVMK